MKRKFAYIFLLYIGTLNGLYAQMGIEPPEPLINNESQFLNRLSPLDAYIQSLKMEETPEDFSFVEYPKPFSKKAIETKKIYAIYFSSLLFEDHPNYNYSSLIDSSNFQFKYDTAGKLNFYEGNNIALIERDKGWSSKLLKTNNFSEKSSNWKWMAPDMDSLDVEPADRFNTPVESFFGPYRKFCSIKRNELKQISSYTITEILPKFDKNGSRSARISLYNGSYTNYEINNYTYNDNGNIQKIIKYRGLNDTIFFGGYVAMACLYHLPIF